MCKDNYGQHQCSIHIAPVKFRIKRDQPAWHYVKKKSCYLTYQNILYENIYEKKNKATSKCIADKRRKTLAIIPYSIAHYIGITECEREDDDLD